MSNIDQTGETPDKKMRLTNNPPDCENADCHHKRAAAGGSEAIQSKPESMEDCMGRSMELLSNTFAASAKRWEMIVYPSLFAFVLLAAYGFFLIYSLSTNVSRIAESMDSMTKNMTHVAMNMEKVTQNMVLMTQTVDSQSTSLHEVVANMRGMNHSMSRMRHDMSVMNGNVSRPMSFMNSFMPW
ncbi:MAG: hypothetical protein OEY52_13500 [Gammaproteobacteria bacterium]|nr:hypothetical protein [Gammaproteobacteria bacterium]